MPPAVASADVEGEGAVAVPAEKEDDLYTKLKTLQRQLEFLDIQEEYIKARSGSDGRRQTPHLVTQRWECIASPALRSTLRHAFVLKAQDEQKNLKRELLRAQEEVKRIQSVPLVIGQFLEMVDANTGIVGSTTGNNYYVRILSTLNRELLKPSASVALHRHSNALVDILPPEADSSISLMSASEKPDVSYAVRAGENTTLCSSPSPHSISQTTLRLRRTSAGRIARSRRSARLLSCR